MWLKPGTVSSKMIKVEMGLKEGTIADIEYLKSVFETNNRTDAVAKAVRIAKKLVQETLAGNSVIIERGWFEEDSKLVIR
jgi:hypothetical protein